MRRSLNIFFWVIFFLFSISLVGGAGYFVHTYYAPVAVSIQRDTLTEPYSPLVILFSQSMRPDSMVGKIKLSPTLPFSTRWEEANTKLVLTPTTPWPIGTTLRVSIGQGQSKYFAKNSQASFSMTTEAPPKIQALFPANNAKDVVLDIEDPISVTLKESANNFYIDFRIDGEIAAVNDISADRTIFQVLPQSTLSSGKEHTLDIYAKWRGMTDDPPVLLSGSKFSTLPPKPSTWNNNFAERIEEAKRYTRATIPTGKYIDINLTSQVMTLFENGKLLDTYMVSSGKRGLETPKGTFAISNKADRPWSKKYGLYMPYWMALVPSGLFGIHELPEWPGGYKEGAAHLGTPVSHGCVRLGVGPAKRVYDWTDIGTPVVIY